MKLTPLIIGTALFIALLAIPSMVSAAPPNGLPPQAQASPKAAFHQTQVMPDGSKVTFTASTEGMPSKGDGVDLGTFKVKEKDIHAKHGGKFADPANPARGLASMKRMTDCDATWAWGRVDFDNYVGVNLFTYFSMVGWDYCDWTVTRVFDHYAWSQSSCCGWAFQGNDNISEYGEGEAHFQAFASATYQVCVFWWCNTRSPWMILQGNGNGNLTGFWWGV